MTSEHINRQIESGIIQRLKEIGFPACNDDWMSAKPEISPDQQTLKILGHPVMERWEEPYMRKLAGIASNAAVGGRLLEVGFGLGMSASYIQECPPDEHVIIEMNHEIAKSADSFAHRCKGKVTVLRGLWQEVVPSLPSCSFDAILFDTYPMTEQEVDEIFHPFIPHAFRLLKEDGTLTYYSDEADWFRDEHIAILKKAGFKSIDGQICQIAPPASCEYWEQKTILAPIVRK